MHKKLHCHIKEEKKLRKIENCISDEDFNHQKQICQKKKEEQKKKLEAEEKLWNSMELPSIPCLRAEGCGVPKL